MASNHINVSLTPDEFAHVKMILDRELAGHQNRLEDAVVEAYAEDHIRACALSARSTRMLRAKFNAAKDATKSTTTTTRRFKEPSEWTESGVASWYQQLEQELTKQLGYGAILSKIAGHELWESKRLAGITPVDAATWALAQDGE